MTIDKLPREVLLEIFDCYRLSFSHQKSRLRVWNNKNGWFKLAHVCHKWRYVVLASPRRLRLLLFLAESTPTKAAALESQSLSQLPIHLDFTRVVWNAGAKNRLISALRYPNRVLTIAIDGSKHFDKISKALDLPFPALVDFELYNMQGNVGHILLASSFMTSIKSLRRLLLANVHPLSIFPLLSVTRSLVFLTLTVDSLFCQTEGASLLTHLQCMPQLREIQLSSLSTISNFIQKPPITTALLAELSYFYFSGQCTEIEWLVAGLVTPLLRGLQIYVIEYFRTLQIPHLSKFIRVAGINFCAARLSFWGLSLTTTMFAPPHSIDDQPRMATFRTLSNAHLDGALSPMLATLEDVFLWISIILRFYGSLLGDHIYWRKFFGELRNVKVLRLHVGLAREVADVLRQPTVNPSPVQGETDPNATTTTPSGHRTVNSYKFALDIFPLLEKIVLYPRPLDSWIAAVQLSSGLESFREYAIARQQAGRPVEVLWSYRLPGLFTLPDVAAVNDIDRHRGY